MKLFKKIVIWILVIILWLIGLLTIWKTNSSTYDIYEKTTFLIIYFCSTSFIGIAIGAGRHYLSQDRILENLNRKKIFEIISKTKFVHYSELQRILKMSNGQLQYHLNVLIVSKLIRKEIIGQYTIYSPANIPFETDEISTILKLYLDAKSTTSKVLEPFLSEKSYSVKELSDLLNIKKNSIRYHLRKLIRNRLIEKDQNNHPVKYCISCNISQDILRQILKR